MLENLHTGPVHLSYKLQAPLQSVILVAICLLNHDLSAWQQSVSSAATRQLSCDVSAQLSCYLKAQLQPINSAFISAATGWLSCSLSPHLYSARLHTVSLAAHSQRATNESSCTRSGALQPVSPALTCQLSCDLTAALRTVQFAICRLWLQLSCSLSPRLQRS